MITPLLATKLYVPTVWNRERVVPRPRLVRWLTVGLHRELILISAPAGFGKTTKPIRGGTKCLVQLCAH